MRASALTAAASRLDSCRLSLKACISSAIAVADEAAAAEEARAGAADLVPAAMAIAGEEAMVIAGEEQADADLALV